MRKRGADDEAQNTEAWMTTYADMMSLLLCFFVLLFAYSAIDAHKFREVVQSLRGALGILDSGPSLLNVNQLPAPSNPTQQDLPTDRSRRISEAVQQVRMLLEGKGLDDRVELVTDYRRGVVIRFRDAVLFDFAKAEIKPESEALLDKVAEILTELPNEVVIEGHTDNIPVKPNSEFESNWDLSTKRSIRVLEYFIESAGVGPPERLSASGYGEYRPVAANDSEENRAQNRRVDIVLLVPDDSGLPLEVPAQSAANDNLDAIGGVVFP
jgi:chemotaxis protein MotB